MVDLLKDLDPRHVSHSVTEFSGGIVVFRSGERFFCPYVGPDDDGEIEVRIEHGVYRGYTRDGRPCEIAIIAGRKHWISAEDTIEGVRDIVEFIRCRWDDPRARGLPSEVTP